MATLCLVATTAANLMIGWATSLEEPISLERKTNLENLPQHHNTGFFTWIQDALVIIRHASEALSTLAYTAVAADHLQQRGRENKRTRASGRNAIELIGGRYRLPTVSTVVLRSQ